MDTFLNSTKKKQQRQMLNKLIISSHDLIIEKVYD